MPREATVCTGCGAHWRSARDQRGGCGCGLALFVGLIGLGVGSPELMAAALVLGIVTLIWQRLMAKHNWFR